ncbi:hypothetical protein [Streptomyces sp. TP-A0874]|uniref:hypothetical protein n=1 Tax=Streptomyces sp. TP-A0874 TaxID=549819 RepID=UPI0008538E9A|nr:hypothetical protein [Streptomyces sp. TP-A0874]
MRPYSPPTPPAPRRPARGPLPPRGPLWKRSLSAAALLLVCALAVPVTAWGARMTAVGVGALGEAGTVSEVGCVSREGARRPIVECGGWFRPADGRRASWRPVDSETEHSAGQQARLLGSTVYLVGWRQAGRGAALAVGAAAVAALTLLGSATCLSRRCRRHLGGGALFSRLTWTAVASSALFVLLVFLRP